MSEFWWGLIWLTLFVPFMFLWAYVLWDVFSRHDLRGWEKALWAASIVFLPLIGMFIYFIARPRELESLSGYSYAGSYAYPYAPSTQYRPEYPRASGPAPEANDMETLARLHDGGTLSDEEYKNLTERMSAQQRPAA